MPLSEDHCQYCLISDSDCRREHAGVGLLASDNLGGAMLCPDCCCELDPELAIAEGLTGE